MKRSMLTALLASTIVGGSLFAYSVVSAEEKTTPAAEAKTEAASTLKPGNYTVIKFKGGEITKAELDAQWATLFPDGDAPDFDSFDNNVKIEILKNLVRERLVLDKAYAKKIDTSAEVKKQVEAAKRQIVVQAYLKSIIDELVTDKDLKKDYEVVVEKFKGKEEVKARHILVETEAEAEEIYKKLKDGADFAALAKEKSADKGSGSNGGDLGYFTKERMVPEFGEAAFAAEKGDLLKPVKSDFGWHVILVEDHRPVKAPTFEEAKPKLQAGLAPNAVENYVSKLFDQSNVKYFDADGKELKAEAPVADAPAEKAPAGEKAGMEDAQAAATAAALLEAKKKDAKKSAE